MNSKCGAENKREMHLDIFLFRNRDVRKIQHFRTFIKTLPPKWFFHKNVSGLEFRVHFGVMIFAGASCTVHTYVNE